MSEGMEASENPREDSAPTPGNIGPSDGGQVNPMAMTVAQAARVLSAVGVGRISEDMLNRHIAAGAPTTPDGRINLVFYAAWLNQRDKEAYGS